MKKIKILILIFVILIIGIIITLLLINNNVSSIKSENKILTPEDKVGYEVGPKSFGEADDPSESKIEPELKYVEDNSTYFTIKALTDNYVSTLISGNKEQIKLLLAPNYIEKYNINNNNILNISNIPQSNNLMYKIMITDMKEFTVNNDIKEYIVNGRVRLLENNKIFSYSLMIEINVSEQTYIIYPEKYLIDNKLNNLKIGDKINNYSTNKIYSNNKFSYMQEKTEKEMTMLLFNDFKERLLYYKDDAYNILDSEYSKKRFENKESFYYYLEENKIRIYLMYAEKYQVIKNDNYTDYVCADKYQNIYTFRQNKNNIMAYTVFLDNYTIVSEENAKKYNDANEKTKAKLNLNKIIAMVNTKDYNAIYNHLNIDFRNNNFKNINDLKKYITSNFYDINSIKLKKIDEQNNYYAFTCDLINQRNTKEQKQCSIIISKTKDTNFTMSFSFE